MMKKLIAISATICFMFLFCISSAHAIPTDNYPYIYSNTGCVIYDAAADTITVDDVTQIEIVYGFGKTVEINAIDDGGIYDGREDMVLEFGVDSSGVIDDGGTTEHDVKYGKVTLPSGTYQGKLLTGNVIDGDKVSSVNTGVNFYHLWFEIEPYGGLITGLEIGDGVIYPAYSAGNNSVICHIDGYINYEKDYSGVGMTTATINWNEDWAMQTSQIHQFPTPEPGSLFLLGLGLFGLVGMGIRKKKG